MGWVGNTEIIGKKLGQGREWGNNKKLGQGREWGNNNNSKKEKDIER